MSGCCAASAWLHGDPHVVGFDGDKFSVRGDHGQIYSLLSAPGLSFNAQFEEAAFRSPHSKLDVKGSFVRKAFWVLRTPKKGRVLRIKFDARQRSHITEANMSIPIAYDGGPPWEEEGVRITFKRQVATIETGYWRMTAKSTTGWPHAHLVRMNLHVSAPRHLACADPVAAHGIMGQTFDCDGMAVHGARDSYDRLDNGSLTSSRTRLGGVMTTTAQGEGALEGGLHDYLLRGPFEDPSPKFSRFDARAPVGRRQVGRLGGSRRALGSAHRRALSHTSSCTCPQPQAIASRACDNIPHMMTTTEKNTLCQYYDWQSCDSSNPYGTTSAPTNCVCSSLSTEISSTRKPSWEVYGLATTVAACTSDPICVGIEVVGEYTDPASGTNKVTLRLMSSCAVEAAPSYFNRNVPGSPEIGAFTWRSSVYLKPCSSCWHGANTFREPSG